MITSNSDFSKAPYSVGYKVKQLPQAGLEDFRRALRSAVRGLWLGHLDLYRFVESMSGSIHRGLTRAWFEGLRGCGIAPGEITPDEQLILDGEINAQISYLVPFGLDIVESRDTGGRLRDLFSRLEMWTGRYHSVSGLAQSIACQDRKLKWVWNPLKEHCGSCRRLNGRVYRASTWRRYNIYPRMRALECKGYRCGCYFEQTNDPVTPGRPPNI